MIGHKRVGAKKDDRDAQTLAQVPMKTDHTATDPIKTDKYKRPTCASNTFVKITIVNSRLSKNSLSRLKGPIMT